MPLTFAGVRYHLAICLSISRVNNLRHALNANGSTEAAGLEDETFTHVVTDSHRFEGWEVVEERNARMRESKGVERSAGEGGEEQKEIHVVTDTWVEKSIIHGKMQPEETYSADPLMLFSGVVTCATTLRSFLLESQRSVANGALDSPKTSRTSSLSTVNHRNMPPPCTTRSTTTRPKKAKKATVDDDDSDIEVVEEVSPVKKLSKTQVKASSSPSKPARKPIANGKGKSKTAPPPTTDEVEPLPTDAMDVDSETGTESEKQDVNVVRKKLLRRVTASLWSPVTSRFSAYLSQPRNGSRSGVAGECGGMELALAHEASL
ncbi:hypothetical protein BDQ12DRAFT_737619 [Crucibulum laeve]|uniref:BRCT domain-containing protein n=1 Tax=Crucibulum laeve TaxID=68775 RepID=A0A5C3LR60_9AGAR|nr:hypothetical protein BDQ12DRAFT_737619 [Crucibulum laeve]